MVNMITKPGPYKTRDGKRVEVPFSAFSDKCPATVGFMYNRYTRWVYANTGRSNGPGGPNTDYDIVGPWVEPDVITGPGEYMTCDGRKVTIGLQMPDAIWDATDLKMMVGGTRCGSNQRYCNDGSVLQCRRGEENDRVIGPWKPLFDFKPGTMWLTRDGQPAVISEVKDNLTTFMHKGEKAVVFTLTGMRFSDGQLDPVDIVGALPAPAAGPVQEVTEKRLVEGTYGIVTVYVVRGTRRVELTTNTPTTDELRAAAKTLIEIADFVDAS